MRVAMEESEKRKAGEKAEEGDWEDFV